MATFHEDHDSFTNISDTTIADGAGLIGAKFHQISSAAELPSTPQTTFDATSIPVITIMDFYERIRTFTKLSNVAAIGGYVMVKRLCADPQNALSLHALSQHRLLLTACMVAAKFWDFDQDLNLRWAKVGGISLRECNELEVDLLNACDFNLRINPPEFEEAVNELLALRSIPFDSIPIIHRPLPIPHAPGSHHHRRAVRHLLGHHKTHLYNSPSSCSTSMTSVSPLSSPGPTPGHSPTNSPRATVAEQWSEDPTTGEGESDRQGNSHSGHHHHGPFGKIKHLLSAAFHSFHHEHPTKTDPHSKIKGRRRRRKLYHTQNPHNCHCGSRTRCEEMNCECLCHQEDVDRVARQLGAIL